MMHIVSGAEWREHRAEVASLIQAICLLAKGQELMSTATAAALARLEGLETKFDTFIANVSTFFQLSIICVTIESKDII